MELLGYIKNKIINKYRIKDIYNKNVCIYVNNIEGLKEIQRIIYEFDKDIILLDISEVRKYYARDMCISIEYMTTINKLLKVYYDEKEYYKQEGYKVILPEDILFE